MKAFLILLLPILLLPILPPGAAAQEPDPEESRPEASHAGLPLVSLDELRLVHYAPRHIGGDDLTELLWANLGRELFVKERGGIHAAPVENISLLGARILLHDTAEHVARMRKFLEQLDLPMEATGSSLEVWEHRTSYLSAKEVNEALKPFSRRVELPSGRTNNMSWRQDVLVVHETPDALDEIRSLLKRIDVPREQVLVTSYLLGVQNKEGGDASPLPQELIDNLETMLPGRSFLLLSYAVLRTSVGSGREVRMRMERGGAHPDYEVSMRMVAWAGESGDLTVAPLVLSYYGHGDEYDVFSTSTTLKGGEYTVLGATGNDPIFLVLRFEPVR